MLLFRKGDFQFSIDLKFGYHHVDIAEVHYMYLSSNGKVGFCVYSISIWFLHSILCVYQVIMPIGSLSDWQILALRIVVCTLMMACLQRVVRGTHVRQVNWSTALLTKRGLQLTLPGPYTSCLSSTHNHTL